MATFSISGLQDFYCTTALGSCYLVKLKPMAQGDGQQYCQYYGMDLASVETAAEANYLSNLRTHIVGKLSK